MIIEAIINVLALIVLAVIKVFPAIPNIDTSYLSGVMRVISLLDTFVSLKVVSSCFVAIFVLMNAHVLWSVIMWVVRKLPVLK